MWRWVEHTRTDARDWTCRIASLETCSSPQNAAIYTWAALWPQSWDERPTETALAWRVRAYQYAMTTVSVPYHLDRISVGEMQWLERQICVSSDAQKRQKTQQKISWPVTSHVCPAIPEGSPGEVPVISCPENRMQVIEHGEWSRWKIPVARTARVVSQNVGPLGLRHVISLIQKIIMTQRPSVIFLQDCKLKETDANSIANLRQAFPQYNILIRSGSRQETRRMHLKKGE
jgi:hypothetical protein